MSRNSSSRTQVNYQLILNIILLCIGIIFMIFPTNGLSFVAWILGIALCLAGVVCGIIAFIGRKKLSIPLIISAVVGIILGIVVMVFRMQITTIILPIFIGLWVIASAALCLFSAWGYRKVAAPLWWLPLIAALVALIVAILIFMNLRGAASLLGYIIGIYFIVFSGIRIGEYFTLRKYL